MRHFICLAALFAISFSSSIVSAQAAKPAKSDDTKVKAASVVPPREGKSETIKLFNGRDLEGWVGHEHLWSVKDGVIVAKNSEPIKVSTYLLTKRMFSDFRLLATVKLVESEMHSGISMWGPAAVKSARLMPIFPSLGTFPPFALELPLEAMLILSANISIQIQ